MGRENVEIVAVYVYYTLTTTVEYGSLGPGFTTDNLGESAGLYIDPVYRDKRISVGTQVTLTAKEIDGWTFIGWITYDGTTLSQDMSFTFEMPAGNLHVFALYYNTEQM